MSQKNNISVLVCDDHQIMIDGLALILNDIPNVKFVGKAHNGQEALDWLEKNTADIVLMDINIPVLDGIKTTKIINEKGIKTNVIYLSMINQLEILQMLIESGAKGFLLKNSGKEEMELAINKVMDGENYFDKTMFDFQAKTVKEKPFSVLPKLTKREKEILKLIVDEYTSNEIAEKLFISLGTAETHRRNLISKLAVKNTAGLVRVAIEYNLV